MKMLATRLFTKSLAAAATLAVMAAAIPAHASNPVRISQVYGGGGSASGFYKNDYVELFNYSGAAVNIGGWTLQYGSATGTSFGGSAGNMFEFPANTMIAACGYLLVQTSTAGSGGADLPVAPDFSTTNVQMAATSGKIALINNNIGNNACSGNTVGAIYADVVGYGTGNCFETTAAPVLDNQKGLVRNGAGIVDTNNNSLDFTVVIGPVPRNSASPKNTQCLATPTMPSTWGRIKTIYR